jgi:Palmitoyl protein thioesterase
MKYGLGSILILASAIGALASPTQNVLSFSKPRPLVIWHGLGASALFLGILPVVRRARIDEPPSPTGDSYDSPGILKFQSAIEEMHRGIFIHSVYVDPDSKKDLQATFVRSEYT